MDGQVTSNFLKVLAVADKLHLQELVIYINNKENFVSYCNSYAKKVFIGLSHVKQYFLKSLNIILVQPVLMKSNK